MDKKDIEAKLLPVFGSRHFIKLWWGLVLPGLGQRTPNAVYKESPKALAEYVDKYVEDNSGPLSE